MEPAKLEKIAKFRLWLIDHDIQFVERATGHFQIFNPVDQALLYQVWATTEKIMDNPEDPTTRQQWLGDNTIKKLLLEIHPITNEVRTKLMQAHNSNSKLNTMVVAMRRPAGTVELTIITEDIRGSVDYYLQDYDENMKLNICKEVQLIDVMII